MMDLTWVDGRVVLLIAIAFFVGILLGRFFGFCEGWAAGRQDALDEHARHAKAVHDRERALRIMRGER